MDITVDNSGPYVVAHLRGHFCAEDERQFAGQLHPLLDRPGARLALVLSGLDSVDSKGLGSLIDLVTRARLREGRVILIAPTRLVRGVMEVTQLNKWFEICDDLEEAARHLS